MTANKPKQPDLAWPAIKGGLIIAVILTPVLFVGLTMFGVTGDFDLGFSFNPLQNAPEIRCFDDNNCILHISGKWYIVTDVLEEEDVPLKFRINLEEVVVEDSLSEEPEAEEKPQP